MGNGQRLTVDLQEAAVRAALNPRLRHAVALHGNKRLTLFGNHGDCAVVDGILRFGRQQGKRAVQCEYYALEGLSDLMTTMRAVKRRLNPTLGIFGVLLTMYDGRTNFSAQVAEEVRRHFPGKVFAAVIPRNVRLSEAPSHGLPIFAYDRFSRGAAAYDALVQEILTKGA